MAFVLLIGASRLCACFTHACRRTCCARSRRGSRRSAATGETVTVRFWNHWLARAELIDQIIADFEQDFPNIDVENLGQPWDRREENMFAALASNDPPEVVMATRAELLKLANDGLIVPITDMVEEQGLDLEKFYPAEINNFYWEGELYSMPMPTGGGITGMILINKDMFEAAGLEPVPPQTWQELWDVGKALTVVDDKGIVQIGANVGTSATSFFGWLYTNNGQIYSDDLRSVAFNSPEGVETLQWMVDYTNEINGGVQDVLDFYVTGQEANEAQPWYNDIEAMQFPNVSIFFHMQTFKPELQWDLGHRPYNANNPDAKSQGISGEEFAWGYVIPSGVPEEKREAAFEWIKKITYEEDAAGWFMIQQSRPSPIRAETKTRSITRRILPGTKCLPRWVTMCLSHLPEHVRVRDIVNQAVEAAMFGPLRRPKRRSTTPLSKRRPYSTSSGVHRNDSAVLAWGGRLAPPPTAHPGERPAGLRLYRTLAGLFPAVRPHAHRIRLLPQLHELERTGHCRLRRLGELPGSPDARPAFLGFRQPNPLLHRR